MSEHPPLVTSHGYGGSSDNPMWSKFDEHLEAYGFDLDKRRRVDKGRILTTIGDPRDYAEDVAEKVEEAYRAYNQEVTLLGHSMGGVDSRWYVEEMGGHEYVDRLVSVGTPHYGTYAAYAGYFSAGGRALTPNSDPLRDLNSGGLADDVSYVAVRSSTDPLVLPQNLAMLAGAENIELKGWGHTELIWRRRPLSKYVHHLL